MKNISSRPVRMLLVTNVRGEESLSCAAALGARASTANNNSTGTNCYAHNDVQFQHTSTFDDVLTREIMSRFHSDDVGHLCKTDPMIVLVGRRRFLRNKGKVDKTMEIKRFFEGTLPS